MVRDYSAFLPGTMPVRRAPTALERLGWGPSFASQIDVDTLIATPPVRVVAVHALRVRGAGTTAHAARSIVMSATMARDVAHAARAQGASRGRPGAAAGPAGST